MSPLECVLMAWAERLCTTRFFETIVRPVVADMQFECAGDRRFQRVMGRVRGYGALLSASLFYGVLLPGQHIREGWSSLEAPGPRLLGRVLPRTALYGTLLVGVLFFDSWSKGFNVRTHWQLDLVSATLMLPSLVLMLMPLVVSVGIGLALAGSAHGAVDRRSGRDLGLVAALLAFALAGYVVPPANQAFREAAYRVVVGKALEQGETYMPPLAVFKGNREMSLSELEAAIAETRGSTWTSIANKHAALRIEWQKRFSLPALCLSLVVFATVLARTALRPLLIAAMLLVTFTGAALLLRVGEQLGDRGELPVVLAAWGCHILPLFLTVLCARYRVPLALRTQG